MLGAKMRISFATGGVRKCQRAKIERLHLKTRKAYRIDNPFLGPETPLADRRLWFDPTTYR